MNSVLDSFVLTLGSSLAASIVAKATIIAALGLIGARLARRKQCLAVRHLVLASTFTVLLLLPLASIIEPPVPIAVSAANGGGRCITSRSKYLFRSLRRRGGAARR